MIKANELRINNWVEYEGNYYQIFAVDSLKSYKEWEGDVHIKEIVNGVHISYAGRWLNFINPICLTPEILEKAGFDKICDDEFRKGNLTFVLAKYEKGFSVNVILGAELLGHYEYVHQLQNLYFALTNKELQINPTHLSPSLP